MYKLQMMLVLALLTMTSTVAGTVSGSWGQVHDPDLGQATCPYDPSEDSLQMLTNLGDSCMKQYNTLEALKYYQQAYVVAKAIAATQAKEKLSQLSQLSSINKEMIDKLEKLPEEKQMEIIERLKRAAEMSAVVDCGIQMKLADCYYKRADYRQAADLLKNVPEDSLSHEAFRELAYSYQKQGDHDSYVYWTSRLVGHYPMDGEMVAGLILGYTQQSQPEKGIICGMKYSLRDSTNILVNRALADAWFMNRDFSAAAKLYDRLLAQGDSTFNTLYSAGMSHSQTGHLERAYQCLLPALYLSQMQHQGCAYRLGVVCVDTKRYEEGLGYLNLARELMKPDTTVMKAITLSQGEGYYLTEHYKEAVDAWKEHLKYNPGSIATYYNVANACMYLLDDRQQAEACYRKFLDLARKEEKPTEKLTEMMKNAEDVLKMLRKRG